MAIEPELMLNALFPIDEDIASRVDALNLGFNHYGIDRFGIDRAELGRLLTFFARFYHHYFRVRVVGIENVPDAGRTLLIGNHSGGLPIDGSIVMGSLAFEKEPPRLAHAMVDEFFYAFPGTAQLFARTGQFTGNPEQAARLLVDERVVLAFPEGARGTAKLAKEADSLVRFGSGFMRLAIQMKCPIVPFAFIGGGEALPTIANLTRVGKLFGLPYIPVPRYLLMLPRPTSLELIYGEPMVFEGTGNETDAEVFERVEQVRDRIAGLIRQGRQFRNGQLCAKDIVLG
ncbi:MAG: lysophospholipid acyltransferase family protein [Polyangiales bacterium]